MDRVARRSRGDWRWHCPEAALRCIEVGDVVTNVVTGLAVDYTQQQWRSVAARPWVPHPRAGTRPSPQEQRTPDDVAQPVDE